MAEAGVGKDVELTTKPELATAAAAQTVVLPVGLPTGPDFTDTAEDGRDTFMDMWGELAERALTELHSVVEASFGTTFDPASPP